MQNPTILTITDRPDWLAGMRPILHATGRRRLILTESLGEATRLLEVAKPHLIVVHDTGGDLSYDELDALLWANSVQQRPAPLLVIVDGYSVEQATRMFQMGVDEYICSVEHADRLGAILYSLLDRASESRTPRLVDATRLARLGFRSAAAASSS